MSKSVKRLRDDTVVVKEETVVAEVKAEPTESERDAKVQRTVENQHTGDVLLDKTEFDRVLKEIANSMFKKREKYEVEKGHEEEIKHKLHALENNLYYSGEESEEELRETLTTMASTCARLKETYLEARNTWLPLFGRTTEFTIFVKTLTGKTITLRASNNATLVDIMEQIAHKEGIDVYLQRLIFAGKQLNLGDVCEKMHIRAESTLHLVLRIRGC
jgi:large subunit ribosomal protein L40e